VAPILVQKEFDKRRKPAKVQIVRAAKWLEVLWDFVR